MAQAAMNALVDFDVVWVPLSLMASSTGIGAVSGTLPRASSASSRASMRCYLPSTRSAWQNALWILPGMSPRR
jgi:hypothetical protein